MCVELVRSSRVRVSGVRSERSSKESPLHGVHPLPFIARKGGWLTQEEKRGELGVGRVPTLTKNTVGPATQLTMAGRFSHPCSCAGRGGMGAMNSYHCWHC